MPLPTSTAAILYGPRDIQVEDRPLWPPSYGQIQIKVVSTGLCGSDLHYYMHGRNGDFAVRAPLVLGHESSGIITAIGPGVNTASHVSPNGKAPGLHPNPHNYDFYMGQKVAIEPGINCRTCSYCVKGRYNLCKGMRFCSSAARFPHIDGTLQTRINHPAHVVHPLPDSLPLRLASLSEPLSVLIHASRRCGLSQTFTPSLSQYLSPSTSTILVFGVGAIGLLACALARHRGSSRIVAIDINSKRLDFAKKEGFVDEVFCLPPPPASSSNSNPHPSSDSTPKTNGVHHPLKPHPPNPTQPPSPKEMADDQLRKAKESAMAALASFGTSDGFDVVYECTGAESAIQMSVFCTTTGGRVMLIGMGTRSAYIPLSTAALREVDILGSFRYADAYPEALALLSGSQTFPSEKNGTKTASNPTTLASLASKLVTHRYKLRDAGKAFEILARGEDERGGLVLKVVVEGDEDD